MFRIPVPVLVLGAGIALGTVAALGIMLFVPYRDQGYVLAGFAGFLLLACVVTLNLPPVVGRASRARWDRMPEKKTCPACLGSGALRYCADGTRVPVPAHQAASFAGARTCQLCLGLGFVVI